MEQSELSKVVATLKIAYPGHFKEFKSVDVIAFVNLLSIELEGYPYEVVNKAVYNIVGKSKFMPSISDIKDECKNCVDKYELDLLRKMYDDGYFHKGFEQLDNEHASRNYEKANMWVGKGIIPEWLLKDMMEYGYKPILKHQEQPLLIGE